MKLAVFNDNRLGVVEGDRIRDITTLVPKEFDGWSQLRMNWLIRNWDAVAGQARTSRGDVFAVEEVSLRAANPAPPQIFAIPANYHAHLGEIGARSVTTGGRTAREVGFFLKAAASVSGQSEGIQLPPNSSRRFDHECELAVIIGTSGRNIPREAALSHVFGYSCLVDMSMRIEPGQHEEERSLRKSFATFTPVGPWLVTADDIPDVNALRSTLAVNRSVRQNALIGDMIVGIAEAIELISSVVPLQAGDLIASGTPQGVGPVSVGDLVDIAIDSIGAMSLAVTTAPPSPRSF